MISNHRINLIDILILIMIKWKHIEILDESITIKETHF